MSQIRVLIVDDHTIVREGVRMLLAAQPGIEVVGEGANGHEAVQKARELRPDVVVMDIAMPGMTGLDATRLIKQSNPEVQVLALTVHESEEYFFRLLSAGGSGYVLKGAGSADLIAAVQAVARGDVFLSPSVAKKLVSDYLTRVGSGEEQDSYGGLTAREQEVLKLLAEGYTAKEIADKLVVSVSTVQTHRTHIMRKLNLHSRAELIKYAIRRGLIDMDA